MTNCKACNAPLKNNIQNCEYCGALVEDKQVAALSLKTVANEASNYIPKSLKSDSYVTQQNSIKPQVGSSGDGIHWTIIISFVFSLLLFFTSFTAEVDKDWITGFIFLGMLSFAFNMSGVKNYSQKNWMVTTNYVLLFLSVLCSFISLT